MKLGYCPFDEFLNTDFPCTVDCHVVGMSQNPRLVIDNIYDSTGKAPMMHNEDAFYRSVAHRIANMAEKDEELLSEAVKTASYEEAA